MKKAFTLAEMMIVLVVIAVITAILLPAARHATPDENILKFKKAHNTLYTAIRELVNSDEYYLDGLLSTRPNGALVNGASDVSDKQNTSESLTITSEDDIKYFCSTLADVLSAKKVDCKTINTDGSLGHNTRGVYVYNTDGLADWTTTLAKAKGSIDRRCAEASSQVKAEIILADGTEIFQANPAYPFGFVNQHNRVLAHTLETPNGQVLYRQVGEPIEGGFLTFYKIICIDVDGVHKDATISRDCVNECPFGYGIRVDGKIINGARADEWLEKSINKKD